MRWLWLLATLQFAAILVLIWRVLSLEQSLVATATASSLAEHAQSGASHSASSYRASPYSSSAPVGELDHIALREIIREELQAAMANKSTGGATARQAPDPVYSPVFEDQLRTVSAKVDSVISAGAINGADMESLHLEIGQLHPKDRRAVLSRLAKSINAGTVKLTH